MTTHLTTDTVTHYQSVFCICDKCESKVAAQHRAADEACGRDWDTGGCQCATCVRYRGVLADVHAGFERLRQLDRRLASMRAIRRLR
jgi:hypothetical protein